MVQTNYQGMGLYPMQEDKSPESFRDAMSKRMGLLQLGTGERPLLYGRKEGVGLYAGGGETGQSYKVASTQPVAAPTAPESPVGTIEWIRDNFTKKKEKYLLDLKNQKILYDSAATEGASLDEARELLKSKNLLNLKEPTLTKEEMAMMEEERKSKQPAGDVTKTIETAEGIMQWNPETQRYDIPVGKGKATTTSADSKEEQKQEARQRVTTVLNNFRDVYDQLETSGAMVSTEKGSFGNVLNRLAASGVGQGVAGALGTKTQSLRNQINQMKPLLIQDMRKATEMGVRGMDSEKELEFYMQAVTDPRKDIQSVRAALNVLSAAYGLGDPVLSKEERIARAAEVQRLKGEAEAAGFGYEKSAEQPSQPSSNDPLGLGL